MSQAPSKKSNLVYSIGYATKPIGVFIAQLKNLNVNVVADVRSVPFSKAFHDYHQPAIKHSLLNEGIRYVYLGEELGPRSKNKEHYNEQRQVQFSQLMRSALFQQGIARLKTGIEKGYTIALMCAEKHPLDCHRSLLIGHFLKREEDINLMHVLHDGSLISQQDLETELVNQSQTSLDLFASQNDVYQLAWEAQCRLKAYVLPDAED